MGRLNSELTRLKRNKQKRDQMKVKCLSGKSITLMLHKFFIFQFCFYWSSASMMREMSSERNEKRAIGVNQEASLILLSMPRTAQQVKLLAKRKVSSQES